MSLCNLLVSRPHSPSVTKFIFVSLRVYRCFLNFGTAEIQINQPTLVSLTTEDSIEPAYVAMYEPLSVQLFKLGNDRQELSRFLRMNAADERDYSRVMFLFHLFLDPSGNTRRSLASISHPLCLFIFIFNFDCEDDQEEGLNKIHVKVLYPVIVYALAHFLPQIYDYSQIKKGKENAASASASAIRGLNRIFVSAFSLPFSFVYIHS